MATTPSSQHVDSNILFLLQGGRPGLPPTLSREDHPANLRRATSSQRERTTLPTFAGPPHRRERGPPCQSPPFIPAQQREREDHPASLPLSHVSGDHTTSLKGRLASSDDGTEAYLRRGPGGFDVYALLPSRGAFGRALQIQEDSRFVVEKP